MVIRLDPQSWCLTCVSVLCKLQMLQTPLYTKETEQIDETCSSSPSDGVDDIENGSDEFENGDEGLAIRIAVEVI